ncbi:hypothetical protein [Microbacterium sp.]|uniref:hypothetical protein n=1 Tax=Microbacterium sp. TaxID=51671 RepID=UPI0039E6924D
MKHVATVGDADELAAEILRARSKPLVLISTDDAGGFAFDPERVADELGDGADVVTIATGDVTRHVERLLPEKTHAFGGAARSYPPDFGADPRWQRSLLRFPARSDVNDLIDDAFAQISFTVAQQVQPRRTWARAIVERLSGASGNVGRLENGDRVMIVADLLPSSLTLASGLRVGDTVEGWLAGRDLAPEPDEPDLARFAVGVTTLARVVKVTEARVTVSLHPALADIALRRRDVVPGADDGENGELHLSDLAHVGATLRVRVTAAAPATALSLLDVDPDTPLVDALPLLRGGPPWLREGEDAAAPDAPEAVPVPAAEAPASDLPVHSAAAPSDGPPAATSADVEALRDEVAELRSGVARLGRELRAGTDLETLDRLRDEASAMSIELARERGRMRERDQMIARLTQELREARAARAGAEPVTRRTERESWPSADDWVRHEVTVAWAARTVASEKRAYPIAPYAIGSRFADSLGALDDAQFAKAMRAVVDVVTGRVAEIPSRELHRLRTGFGGDDPFVERADGAKCWRASIEQNAASARRLHYWELPGGRIELSRIVLHDDVEP